MERLHEERKRRLRLLEEKATSACRNSRCNGRCNGLGPGRPGADGAGDSDASGRPGSRRARLPGAETTARRRALDAVIPVLVAPVLPLRRQTRLRRPSASQALHLQLVRGPAKRLRERPAPAAAPLHSAARRHLRPSQISRLLSLENRVTAQCCGLSFVPSS